MTATANASSPVDLVITPRDRRFGRGQATKRWWLGGDPVGTAIYNSLSLTFPRGEAFFVESVKAFRAGVPERLDQEIRAFISQEVMHSREHLAFNDRMEAAGYDVSALDRVVEEMLALTKGRPQILNLAVTMALEHYTAILAQQLISNPKHLRGADAESRNLWLWHASEEIEHKGVAYDVWLHATGDWSRWKRWKVKSIMMLVVTGRFWPRRIQGAVELLRQDGLTGISIWLHILWYLFGTPGLLRIIFPAWISYFLPGFHPWNHDDRVLIALAA